MEWDELVERVAGTEGAPRYKRVGAFLLATSFVAFLSLLFVPLLTSGDVSYSYFDLSAEPEDLPFQIPNRRVTALVDLSLVGCVLTEIVGLLLILEGYRVINLRRFLVWHAEARATALYSLGAATSLVAMAGLASLWGLVVSMPTASVEGVMLMQDAGSLGAMVAVVMMGTVLASMLFMAYYSCVLSVYRGGVTPRTRHMARLAMLVALTAVIGLLIGRMGVIATATIEVAAGTDAVADVDVYYTKARVDYFAEDPDGYPLMAALSSQMVGIQVMLALAALAALAGTTGVSAHSLGGTSLKVRRTASLPAIAVLFMVFASFYVLSSGGFSEVAIREVWDSETIPVGLSWGFYLELLLVLAGVALSAMYLREVGYELVIESFAFWKGLDRPKGEAKEPMEGGVGPLDASEERGPIGVAPVSDTALRGPGRLSGSRMKVLAVLFVVVILIAAVMGVMVLRPPSGGNGGVPGRTHIEVEALLPFREEIGDTLYMNEGSSELYDALMVVLGPMEDNADRVYFVNMVVVSVLWTDEPDAGIRWTNQPDAFTSEVYDSGDIFGTGSDTGENTQGGGGSISASWTSAEFWLAWGNADLVDPGDADVIYEASVYGRVDMDQAGDQTTRLGLTQADTGNECTVHIEVFGNIYLEEENGQ